MTVNSDSFVRQFLDLSTGHLSQEAEHWLNSYATATGEYGWLCSVRDKEERDDLETYGIPTSLARCMELAEQLNCGWILFDLDADAHPDLGLWVNFEGRLYEADGPVDEIVDADEPEPVS